MYFENFFHVQLAVVQLTGWLIFSVYPCLISNLGNWPLINWPFVKLSFIKWPCSTCFCSIDLDPSSEDILRLYSAANFSLSFLPYRQLPSLLNTAAAGPSTRLPRIRAGPAALVISLLSSMYVCRRVGLLSCSVWRLPFESSCSYIISFKLV